MAPAPFYDMYPLPVLQEICNFGVISILDMISDS
jgi:hypothetical protein